MTSPPSIHYWTTSRGVSLAEVLVALVTMGIIMAMVVPLALSSRDALQSDQLRTSLNLNLRGATDIIGQDVRTAGERFTVGIAATLNPIHIVEGAGSEGDELVLRRNLWESALALCQANIAAGSSNPNVQVVRPPGNISSPHWSQFPECFQPVNSEGWPQNLWDLRLLIDEIGDGGTIGAFFFDPPSEDGDFFELEVPDNADSNRQIRRVDGGSWSNNYNIVNQPRIYVMEERRYRVRNGILELVRNGNEDEPLRVAAGIARMEAQYVLADGSMVRTLPEESGWRDVRSIDVTFEALSALAGDEAERNMNTRFFPRNILSR